MYPPPKYRSFERRICAQTQDVQIFKKFNMSQMNPKEVFHNTAYSVQLPNIAVTPFNTHIYLLISYIKLIWIAGILIHIYLC